MRKRFGKGFLLSDDGEAGDDKYIRRKSIRKSEDKDMHPVADVDFVFRADEGYAVKKPLKLKRGDTIGLKYSTFRVPVLN